MAYFSVKKEAAHLRNGFSRFLVPGRSQHQALDALYTGLLTRKVNWVLDLDIQGFFDGLSHEWPVKFIEHRIADRRVVRFIQKWLNAGVLEGKRIRVEEGTPQGRERIAVAGQHLPSLCIRPVGSSVASEAGARRCDRGAFRGRRRGWIPEQSGCRLVSGGTYRKNAEVQPGAAPRENAAAGVWSIRDPQPAKRGEGKPETFNFLGFTHICVKKRSNGMYTVLRQTMRKRLQAKLNQVKAELRRRMHESIPELGAWLQAVIRGHIRYYGVPMNTPALWLFRFQVGRLWHRALSRRSQNGRVLWDRMRRLINRWLPVPRICHPYPLRRMRVVT
jgi:hypothetical protein